MTLKTEEVMVNIGPQHPSTHGVFRMRVTFDGEVVTDLEPVFGYLHRGTEKLAEERTYTQIITLTRQAGLPGLHVQQPRLCPGSGKASGH